MKRLLLALAVILAGGIAFAQYKVTRSVTEGLENAKRVMAPFVRMEYGDVSATLSGNLEVSDLRFVSLNRRGEIYVQKVALITDNPWVLINLQDRIRNNQIPDHLEFSIEGLLADMAFMNNVENAVLSQNPLSKLETAGCQKREFFDRSDLVAMGYDQLTLDISLGYQLSEGGRKLGLTSRLVLRDQMAVGLKMVLQRPNAINKVVLSAELAKAAQLISANIEIEDLGQLNRTLAFCAREIGTDVKTYQDHHLEAWTTAWRELGLQPSDSLVDVYHDYIRNPGSTLAFEMKPFPALDLGDSYLSPDPIYLSERLNPRMGTENTGMQVISLSPAQQEIVGTATPENVPADESKIASGGMGAAVPIAEILLDGRISLSALDQHLNKDVVITMSNGRTVEGRIESVEGQTLRLKRYMHGGSMVVPVSLHKIRAVALP